MKKVIFLLTFISFGFALINLFTAASIVAPSYEAVVIPDSIQQIFQRSCYECHNSISKNKKAREKLDFDKLNNLKTYQIVGKMVDAAEVIVNNEMPPRKFIKKNPEKVLSDTERHMLTEWVSQLTMQPDQTKITLDSQLEDLNAQIERALVENQKLRIAILEFTDMQGTLTGLGWYISEELKTSLELKGVFKLADKQSVDKVVQELQLPLNGNIDDSSSVVLGNLLGVEAIASGSVIDMGSIVKVNILLISATTGKLFSVASVEIPQDENVRTLLSQIISTASDRIATKSPKPAPTPPAEIPIVETGGFRFRFIEARIEGRTIICNLKITNPGENDKVFQMRAWFKEDGNTVVYDDLGNEYYISAAKFDDKMVNEMFYVHKTSTTILAGTSLNLEIYFEDEKNTPKNAKKITVLKIISEIDPWFTVEFKNIPFKKSN